MEKLLGLLGLAYKAGAVTVGTNNVLAAIKSGKALLVITAEDVSHNTAKLLGDKSGYRNIRLIGLPVSMEQLAHNFGKSSTSSVAITNKDFVNAVLKHIP